jgi:hypothetical protein
LTVIVGCGVYTFNPAGKSSIRTIAVEPFENQTQELELGDRITEVVIEAFINDGKLKVVAPSSADAVLVGNLTGYRRVPNEFTETDEVISYKLLMDFEIKLINPDDQSEIWTERMNQQGVYDADTETEEVGQLRAVERLIEDIINRTTKSW